MSLEAWGDDDGAGDYDHLIDAGWWTSEQAREVVDAVKALAAETVYEGGEKANGLSVRFIMRLNLLQSAAGLEIPRELVDEAERFFAAEPGKGVDADEGRDAGKEKTDERG